MHGDAYILVGNEHSGGILKGQLGVPPHWLCYVNAENTVRTVAQVLELGGRVVIPATDMPGVRRFAVLTDPRGAVFAVMGG